MIRPSDTLTDCEAMDTLTPTQLQAIKYLIEGKMITEVAQLCGIHRNTVTRWKKKYDFANALKDGEKECLEATQHFISSKTLTAAKRLWEIAEDTNNAGKVRSDIYSMFLDRGIGTPTKRVQIDNDDNTGENIDIEAALREAEERIQARKTSA